MIKITQMLVPQSKYNIKCPFEMKPKGIAIHNTANDASAKNEITYMVRNNNQVSFHFAVDNTGAVQGLPLDRNAWHASDGKNGNGNRNYIAIEICYSKSGGDRFSKGFDNAAQLVAYLMKAYGFTKADIKKHQDFSGKHCPHRILSEGTWDKFLNLCQSYYDEANKPAQSKPAQTTGKTLVSLAREVIAGKWGNGTTRQKNITAAGYNYKEVQDYVNKILKGQKVDGSKVASKSKTNSKPAATPAPAKKSNDEIAKEVLEGKWGNGADRKKKLTAAGYNYDAIQAIINKGVSKPGYVTYVVKRGDTLSGIAKRFGKNYHKIAADNRISNPNRLFVGQVLKIYF